MKKSIHSSTRQINLWQNSYVATSSQRANKKNELLLPCNLPPSYVLDDGILKRIYIPSEDHINEHKRITFFTIFCPHLFALLCLLECSACGFAFVIIGACNFMMEKLIPLLFIKCENLINQVLLIKENNKLFYVVFHVK